jgi:hypothetical protein
MISSLHDQGAKQLRLAQWQFFQDGACLVLFLLGVIHMTRLIPRLLRADDFVAETYEKWAANLPPSGKERAAYYLRTAKMFRESSRTAMVRVWEEEKVEFVSAESLIGKRVRFRADFYSTRIMPTRDWTGMIEDERRSSSGQDITSYIVLLDEPFRSQEQDPRVDATQDEMEPF